VGGRQRLSDGEADCGKYLSSASNRIPIAKRLVYHLIAGAKTKPPVAFATGGLMLN
jgi:hypothetical protein